MTSRRIKIEFELFIDYFDKAKDFKFFFPHNNPSNIIKKINK